MTAQFTLAGPLTPHAFDARVAQMTRKGWVERTAYADLHGVEQEFAAFFAAEEDPHLGYNSRHECCPYTVHTLVGAWACDDDDQLYAGNRDEIIALIGEAAVTGWETHANEAGNE